MITRMLRTNKIKEISCVQVMRIFATKWTSVRDNAER